MGGGWGPVGGDFRIGGPDDISNESSPAVAWNATANEYLVVWADLRSLATRGADVYGRRLGADGTRLGSDFRVSGPNAIKYDWEPAVVWNGTANEYLVVWEDDRAWDERNPSVHGWDVYGRRVGAGGVPAGGDFRVNGVNATAQEAPAVAWNGTANEYLVVWQDWRNFGGRSLDVYGRRVGADGTRLGSDFRVSGAKATEYDWEPAVACRDDANECLVVWEDGRNSTRGGDIFGRRVGG
jgi:hypothetical protein